MLVSWLVLIAEEARGNSESRVLDRGIALSEKPEPSTMTSWKPWRSVAALLGIALGVALLRAARNAKPSFLPAMPFPLWGWGTGVLLAGLFLALWAFPKEKDDVPPRISLDRVDGFILVGVMVIAAGLRVYRIYSVPAGLWLDETDIAKQALEIVRGARPLPWEVARLEVPWAYHYYVALFYKILGSGYLTVKLPHLTVSVATAGALYLLAREFLPRPYAALAAILWATMRWSVNMSRWGHVNTLTLFWYTTVLWLVWRSFTRGQQRYWWMGGMALGLSQYSYQATRSLVLVIGLFMALHVWQQRTRIREFLPRVLLFWGVFVLVYAPLAWTYVHHPDLFLERSRAISIFNPLFTRDPWATLKGNFGKYFGMFFYKGDPNGRHNIPYAAVVDPLTAGLLVLGIARILRAPLRPFHALLLLWISAFMTAGILTTEAPNTFRVYGMTPALALVTTLGLESLTLFLAFAASPFRRAKRPSGLGPSHAREMAFPVLLVLIIAGLNLYTFFARQAKDPRVIYMFNVGPTKVGQYIATLPKTVTIYLDREFWAFSPIEVINPERTFTRLKTPDHVPPPPAQMEAVVYILGRYGHLITPYLHTLFPTATVDEGYGPLDDRIYTGIRVDANTVRQRGLLSQWWQGESATGLPQVEGVSFPDRPPVDAPAHGRLYGGLFLLRAGMYDLRVENVRQIRWSLAGHEVITQPGETARVPLPGGLVPVRIEVITQPGEIPRFLWRPPDASEWTHIADVYWYPLDVPEGGVLALWFEGGGLRKPPVRITHAPILFADNAGNLATAAMRWLGRIRVDVSGTYTFGLSSDDGSRLWIDGRLVVDNWGLHGAGWRDVPVKLTAGWHTLRIDYIDNGGGFWFQCRWARPGHPPEPIPPSRLSWRWEDMREALTPPENPPPVIRVVDETGQEIGVVPVAVARLADERFSEPVGDANFQGWPMKVNNRMYDRGIGVYGPGELEFHLDGHYHRLIGMVGVDMDTYGDAHTQVQVIGDGHVLWDSGEIHTWDPPRPFDIDVTGVRVLVLKQIEKGHFEGRGDGVDWIDIRLRRF